MIEPGVRYLPHVPLPSPLPQQMTLEAAVDLSKKAGEHWRPQSADNMEAEDEDSDDGAPIDMSLTAGRLPVFPGLKRCISPATSDRSDFLGRISSGLYSPGSAPGRDWSERSEPDKDDYTSDGCHICGTPRSEMSGQEHGEGICNQRPISCPLCSKTFTLWSHYETHKKCHQKLKQRQYPCQSCGKIFTSASNRNMHQRIHKGVRPFHCAPCGVYFRQKAHLQKHQKTQGHVQASEQYEKKKAEGLIPENDSAEKKDGTQENGQQNSPPSADSSTSDDKDGRNLEVYRSSPKRKQSHPQQQQASQTPHSSDDKEEAPLEPREAQIRSNIDYNNINHGYDCRQCDFSTHELSSMKEHVITDHLRDSAELKCKECQVTFTKPFNLLIHNRKHETSSQFLPCEYCEQVFKVPNKLIKHMEGVHSVCPTCGRKNNDKAELNEHMEEVHGERRKGVHQGLPQLTTSLASTVVPAKARSDIDNRHAKMRKVDSLAEHIRAKQLQNTTVSNIINGNEKPITPSESHLVAMPRRRKSDMPAVRALLDRKSELPAYTKPGLESLVNQWNTMAPDEDSFRKAENNNILSSLSKMTNDLRCNDPKVDRQLTPPSSPPPSIVDSSLIRVTPDVSVTVINSHASDSDDSNETGLDLSLKKERNLDDNEVSTTARESSDVSHDDYYRGQPILPASFPYMVPTPLLLGRMPLPPLPHPGSPLTEHLVRLASLSRNHHVAGSPQELAKPATTIANPHNVLSVMLGHRPPVPPTGFPVFPGGLPPSMFPQHPLPPRQDNRPASPITTIVPAGPGIESKPFRCTYCPKEFGHLSSLESHVERLHTNESKHNCETCGKAFSSKSNLTAHKKIHSGERPFECQICKKRFRQKAHLQKHETTHSSATPYQCPHCDKAFGHPSNLNTHVATHSDVRPYECSDCGKAYKDAASFKRHRLVHTGERPYPCSMCSDTFIDSKSLRRHHETSHPTAVPDTELADPGEDDEDDEEEIEPGKEEVPPVFDDSARSLGVASPDASTSFGDGESESAADTSGGDINSSMERNQSLDTSGSS